MVASEGTPSAGGYGIPKPVNPSIALTAQGSKLDDHRPGKEHPMDPTGSEWTVKTGVGCPDIAPWAVMDVDTGEINSCHKDEASARAHMAGLVDNNDFTEKHRDVLDRMLMPDAGPVSPASAYKVERGRGCPTSSPWAVYSGESGMLDSCYADEGHARRVARRKSDASDGAGDGGGGEGASARPRLLPRAVPADIHTAVPGGENNAGDIAFLSGMHGAMSATRTMANSHVPRTSAAANLATKVVNTHDEHLAAIAALSTQLYGGVSGATAPHTSDKGVTNPAGMGRAKDPADVHAEAGDDADVPAWIVERGHGCPDSAPWAVVDADSGEVYCCNRSESGARAQAAVAWDGDDSPAGEKEGPLPAGSPTPVNTPSTGTARPGKIPSGSPASSSVSSPASGYKEGAVPTGPHTAAGATAGIGGSGPRSDGADGEARKSATKTPYGNVAYADPGYQADGKKRYPIDTAEHVHAALSYIAQKGNAGKYSPSQLSSIKSRISAAAKKLGITVSQANSAGRLDIDVVRAVALAPEFRSADGDEYLGELTGHFSTFGNWYQVDSKWEGSFLERTARSAFDKTIAEERDNMRVLYDHGFDPTIGNKVLGPIRDLRPDDDGAYYSVPLFDTHYNRELLPGLRAGVYGASMRMRVLDDAWDKKPARSDFNPEGLPERTITQATVPEFGPVTFPANPGASAGVRSMTDYFYDQLRQRDTSAYESAVRAAGRSAPSEDPIRALIEGGLTPDEAVEWARHLDLTSRSDAQGGVDDGDFEHDGPGNGRGSTYIVSDSRSIHDHMRWLALRHPSAYRRDESQ